MARIIAATPETTRSAWPLVRIATINVPPLAMVTLWTQGLPDDYYDTFVRKVQSLNVQAVTDTAKSTIRPDNLVWVVVGDRSKIEAPIRELGLGEVKFLDADGNPI